jgi:hypothetical protein
MKPKMKRNLQILVLFVGLNILVGCFYAVSAQKVGGYKEIPKTDQDALAAADFAVKEKAKEDETTIELVSLEKAERQTVAGTNFRLCLKVDVDENEDTPTIRKEVLVVVFRNLKQVFSLTSWEEKDCGEDEK